ncbi:MAG TPA: hypothetical protein VK688_09660 [Gemmatimonadales bacterium]|nr:hypothetical protein [Gemmatimonadales bacterium]
MIGWLLLLQVGLPTVGDTIWVRRTVPLPAGRAVRAAEWMPTDEIEVLGRPQVTLRGDSVEVAYPVTLWAPGQHLIQVPGPLLVGADGQLDSLPPASVTLTAQSVLPGGSHDSLKPRPPTPTITLHERSLEPLLALLAVAALLLIPAHLLWRRRGRASTLTRVGPAAPAQPPIQRWAEAGEPRAVIGATVEHLRGLIASEVPKAGTELDTEACLAVLAEAKPAWPLAELADLLRALDEARFAQGADVDALGMHRQAGDLQRRLGLGAAA